MKTEPGEGLAMVPTAIGKFWSQQIEAKWLGWFCLFIFLSGSAQVLAATPTEFGQEAIRRGEAIFAEEQFPWYDSAKGQPVVLKPREPLHNWLGRQVSEQVSKWKWPEWKWPDWGYTWTPSTTPAPATTTGPALNLNFYDVLSFFMWTLIVLLLLALVYYLIRLFLKSRYRNVSATETKDAFYNPNLIVEHLPLENKHVTSLVLEAERYARMGQYDKAIIYYYGHILGTLDHFQVIRLAKGKTNRRYQSEIRRQAAPLAKLTEAIIKQFEESFFGKHEISQERFQKVWQHREEFERWLKQYSEKKTVA